MIECRNIAKSYMNGGNETHALKGVSFTIRDGEFVSIMGPSGSGKSTLMHILGALDAPTGGEYLLDGKNISNFSDDELAEIRRDKIGFVFQAFQSFAAHDCVSKRYAATPLQSRLKSRTRRSE
jgi:ABC-type lipoprotein export system ATPase subunit